MHTKGNWSRGKCCNSVVSDTIPYDDVNRVGYEDIKYYGGFLIAESIHDRDIPLIAAAPELLKVLKEVLAECEIARPLSLAHLHAAKALIAKAEGRSED